MHLALCLRETIAVHVRRLRRRKKHREGKTTGHAGPDDTKDA
jgi:hypothetical protein